MNKRLFFFLGLMATSLSYISELKAQNAPVFISTPITTASANVPCSYGAIGEDADGDQLTFTAPTLPSWLTFSATGQVEAVPFESPISSPGATAGDAAGNIYVCQTKRVTHL